MQLPPPHPQPLTPAEIRAVQGFYAAWNERRPELLEEVCAPDWQDIPLGPSQAPGPRGLQNIIRRFVAAFPDVHIVVHELFGTHERAGVRGEIRFTNSHRITGAAAPGSSVAVALHEFHHLHHGRLTHTWHLEHGDFQAYAAFALG